MRVSTGTRLLILLVVVIAFVVFLRLLDASVAPSLIDMIGTDALKPLTSAWFHLGPRSEAEKAAAGLDVTPILIIQAVLFIILITILARTGRRFLQTRILRHTSLDVGQQYALSNIFGYTLFIFGLMIGLQTAGLDLSSLTFLGGALGVGIGFGLQAIFSNFVSGLILLIERPIKVGDRIEVGGTPGDVMRIGPRSTWVKGIDNAVIIVPNSEFVTARVRNWTAVSQQAHFEIGVGVAYGSDPEQVRSLLVGIARAHPDIIQDPPPDALLESLGESALKFRLTFWTAQGGPRSPRIMSDLYFHILKAFREHGVEIPYPQRDVHLKQAPQSVSGASR